MRTSSQNTEAVNDNEAIDALPAVFNYLINVSYQSGLTETVNALRLAKTVLDYECHKMSEGVS